MRRVILTTLLAVAFIFGAQPLFAGEPFCDPYNGNPYCQYTGKVQQAYVNSGGMILLYFDTNVNPGAPASAGISGVSIFSAASYQFNDNPEFARMLYSTLLTAQARGATVTVQMRGSLYGYLRMDRVWIRED